MPNLETDRYDRRGTASPYEASSTNALSAAYDERGRTIPWLTRTLHRLYNAKAQQSLEPENISIAHWICLRVLAERGQMTQRELSNHAGIASQTAVPALDSMEKRGLVKRTRDPRDRRKYDVSLTEEGRCLIDRVLPGINEMLAKSLAGISAEEMAVFWTVTQKISDNLASTMSGEPILD